MTGPVFGTANLHNGTFFPFTKLVHVPHLPLPGGVGRGGEAVVVVRVVLVRFASKLSWRSRSGRTAVELDRRPRRLNHDAHLLSRNPLHLLAADWVDGVEG